LNGRGEDERRKNRAQFPISREKKEKKKTGGSGGGEEGESVQLLWGGEEEIFGEGRKGGKVTEKEEAT